jgi:hypothetical protein
MVLSYQTRWESGKEDGPGMLTTEITPARPATPGQAKTTARLGQRAREKNKVKPCVLGGLHLHCAQAHVW